MGLLAGVFGLAAVVTFVLGLDATVVLVTPVVIRVAREKPYLYATGHLANSASLLLPISNLTNLLVLHTGQIGFGRFAVLMALPTVAVIAVEWVVLRWYFASALKRPVRARRVDRSHGDRSWLEALQPLFLITVFALGVVIREAGRHGLSAAVHHALPLGGSLPDLLGVAFVSALLANAVNNLPATLILVPLVAPAGTGPLLAMLIGVGVGPNLTPAGSLATLLWRRVLKADGIYPELREFLTLGALTALPGVLVSTTLLWLALRL